MINTLIGAAFGAVLGIIAGVHLQLREEAMQGMPTCPYPVISPVPVIVSTRPEMKMPRTEDPSEIADRWARWEALLGFSLPIELVVSLHEAQQACGQEALPQLEESSHASLEEIRDRVQNGHLTEFLVD